MSRASTASIVLTPVIRRFVRDRESRGWTPFHKLPVEEARRVFREIQANTGPLAPVEIEERKLTAGVDFPFSVRIVRPAGVA